MSWLHTRWPSGINVRAIVVYDQVASPSLRRPGLKCLAVVGGAQSQRAPGVGLRLFQVVVLSATDRRALEMETGELSVIPRGEVEYARDSALRRTRCPAPALSTHPAELPGPPLVPIGRSAQRPRPPHRGAARRARACGKTVTGSIGRSDEGKADRTGESVPTLSVVSASLPAAPSGSAPNGSPKTASSARSTTSSWSLPAAPAVGERGQVPPS